MPCPHGQARRMLLGSQEGAALVQSALMMVVLLGFVALALDGGLLYAERRRMQNAADAGALAGARAICVGNPGAAVAQATHYACNENGAQSAAVQVTGNQVRVIASETVPTYLAGIIGLPSFSIQAEAKAACGRTTRICGATPILFDASTWDDIPCGREFYVWDDNSIGDDLCTKCECEDVIGSAVSLGPGQRGWVRFSSPPSPFPDPASCGGNCGSSALRCWIQHGYDGPVEIGQCVVAKPGVDASALQAAAALEGSDVYVLLWGPGGCSSTVGDCPGDRYRVTGFGYVRILEADKKLTIPPRPGYKQNDCPKNVKVLRAIKLCNPPATGCGRTDGDPLNGGVGAVSLIP